MSDVCERRVMGSVIPTQTVSTNCLLDLAAIIDKIVCPIAKKMASLSAVLSLFMAVVIILDLIAKYLFNTAVRFVIEGETLLLVVVTFFSIAETQRQGRHVSIEIVFSRFKEKHRLLLRAIFASLGLYFFGVIAWQLFIRGTVEYSDRATTTLSHIPVFPFSFVGAFGCVLLSLVLFKGLLTSLGNLVTRSRVSWLIVALPLGVATAIVLISAIYQALGIQIGKISLGIAVLLFSLILMFLGFSVAFAMGFAGLLGMWLLSGKDVALGFVRLASYDTVAEYYLCVIPFFLIMGLLCLNAGISKSLFSCAHTWIGRMPGGLAIATVLGCGGFASICGDSMANAATMGSVSLPEMKKHGYDDSLATGSVAAGGTLGILIPPSIGFIAYGIITQESVGKLFIAGILPGILLMSLFCAIIYVRCRRNPALGPPAERSSWIDKIRSLKGTWQVVVLFLLVVGGIYSGVVTPTEAGGVGVIGALLLAALSPGFNWQKLFASLNEGVQMTAMIITMLIGVALLGNFIVLTNLATDLSTFLQSMNLSRYVFLVCLLVLYVFLGMVMNIIPMVLITLPVVFPSIVALGFDPIWFGVVMVIMMEMGQISPPVGINVFVIHSTAGNVPMGKIFRGVMPFIFAQVLTVAVLTFFPKIALFLPKMMDVLPPITR